MGRFWESVLHGSPLLIFGLAAIVTYWIVREAMNQHVRVSLIACAAIEAFLGAALAAAMASHILSVIVRRVRVREEMWVRLEPHVTLGGVPYDFRIYSLVLLGALGTWAGARSIRASWKTTHRHPQGCRSATSTFLLVMLLAAPLVPLQPLAAAVLLMSAFGVVVAVASRSLLEADRPRLQTHLIHWRRGDTASAGWQS